MSYLSRFARFWWSFLVGDNLPLAIGAGASIGLTALLVHEGVNAWWLLPALVLALLAASVLWASKPTGPRGSLRRRRDPATRGGPTPAGFPQEVRPTPEG